MDLQFIKVQQGYGLVKLTKCFSRNIESTFSKNLHDTTVQMVKSATLRRNPATKEIYNFVLGVANGAAVPFVVSLSKSINLSIDEL